MVAPLDFLVARALVAPWVLLAASVGHLSFDTPFLQARRMVHRELGCPIDGGRGAVGGVIGGARVRVEALGACEFRELRGMHDPHLKQPTQAVVVGSARIWIPGNLCLEVAVLIAAVDIFLLRTGLRAADGLSLI